MRPRRRVVCDDPANIAAAAVLGSVIGYLMSGDLIGGIIGGVISAAIIGLWNLLRVPERFAYWEPVSVRYEPSLGQRCKQFDLAALANTQHIPVTLEISRRLTMERVGFSFTAGSNKPTIVGLYDWHNNAGLDDKPLKNVTIDTTNQGQWHWQYEQPLTRTVGNTIKIGLRVDAPALYEGFLEVTPTYQERVKMPRPVCARVFVLKDPTP